jgi:hypothetical protein
MTASGTLAAVKEEIRGWFLNFIILGPDTSLIAVRVTLQWKKRGQKT